MTNEACRRQHLPKRESYWADPKQEPRIQMQATKTCRQCGVARPRSQFRKSRREKDGLLQICTVCRSTKARVRKSRRTRTTGGKDSVLCSSCQEWLPASVFSITGKGYYSSRCHECNRRTRSEWVRQRVEHVVSHIIDRTDSALLSHPLYVNNKARLAQYIVDAHSNYRASKARSRQRQRCTPRGRPATEDAFQAVSLDEYAAFVVARPVSCECCGRAFSDTQMADCVVDHCHATGALRGLLCQDCNRGIGLFRDDAQVLVRAKAYLEAHSGTRDVPSL